MRINIVLDDDLVEEAFRCSDNITTRRELGELALKEQKIIKILDMIYQF